MDQYIDYVPDGEWRTEDGHKLVLNSDPINLRIVEINAVNGVFMLDLTKGPSINGMTIAAPNGVDGAKVELVGSGTVLLTTKPVDGKVIFWENWEWICNSACDAKIYISNVDAETLTVTLNIKQLPTKLVPIYIPDQSFVPEMFKGSPYNNVLMFIDGIVHKRYLS